MKRPAMNRRKTSEAPDRPAILAIVAAVLLVSSGARIAALSVRHAGTGQAVPTRTDLDLSRRRVALLQSEQALAATRKPYVVVDLAARTLRYGLMGMDVHQVPLAAAEAYGLRPVPAGEAPEPRLLAGIVTLKEKERDPRLTPLTPAQIEAGATDEDAADVLPPEAPASYGLIFQQGVVMRVSGLGEGGTAGLLSSIAGWWRRLWGAGPRGSGNPGLRLVVTLEENAARDVYRSLVPGQRLVIAPPPGFVLPDAGQEAPAAIRPGRAAPPPKEPPTTTPGVPFRIPPPVESPPAVTPEEAQPPAGAPPEAAPPPEEAPLPEGEDWVPVDPEEDAPPPADQPPAGDPPGA
jgi:hypothetical protein